MKIAEVRVNIPAVGIDKNFSYRMLERLNFIATSRQVTFGVKNFVYNVAAYWEALK